MAELPVNVAPYFLYGFPDVPVVEMFDRASGTAVDGIEFALLGDPDLATIEEQAAATGLDVGLLLSGDGDPNTGPMCTDPDKREEAIEQLRADIRRAARLGCGDVAVLTGTDRAGIGREEQFSSIVAVLREVAEAAAAAAVDLHIEPVSPADSPAYLLSDVETAAAIVDRIDHPRVDILYDIYHQQMTDGTIINTFDAYADRIGYVHVANAPDRGPPDRGELAIYHILDAILDSEYDGPIGCEFTAPDAEMAAADEIARYVDAA
jgi:hydroxypyruvate isomerase